MFRSHWASSCHCLWKWWAYSVHYWVWNKCQCKSYGYKFSWCEISKPCNMIIFMKNHWRNFLPAWRPATFKPSCRNKLWRFSLFWGIPFVLGQLHCKWEHLQFVIGKRGWSRCSRLIWKYCSSHGCGDKSNGKFMIWSIKIRVYWKLGLLFTPGYVWLCT